MSAINTILDGVSLPKMAPVRQLFSTDHIADVPGNLLEELGRDEIRTRIKPGMRIAITAGSRGVDNYLSLMRTLVEFIKSQGAEPYAVAAMGSHGGATVEGQKQILDGYGITEENLGCPVKIGNATKRIGVTKDGLPVQIDAYAAEADGIILMNRIKTHTAFHGKYESGLMKMMAIGLAKQPGADYCHERGFGVMAEMIESFGRAILQDSPVLFGIALVENSYDKTCVIRAIPAERIPEEEPPLLALSKEKLAHILIPSADLLIVHEIGKNISGDGMDPNVSGTFATPFASGGIDAQRVAVLRIAKESHGNAVGWGMADTSTQAAFQEFRPENTYPNSLTCRVTQVSKVPLLFENDLYCIKAAIKTAADLDLNNLRIVYIKNTLRMDKILVSEALLPQVEASEQMLLAGPAKELEFDADGNIGKDYFA